MADELGSIYRVLEMHRGRLVLCDALLGHMCPVLVETPAIAIALWSNVGARVSLSGAVSYSPQRRGPRAIYVNRFDIFPNDSELPTAEEVFGILSQDEEG